MKRWWTLVLPLLAPVLAVSTASAESVALPGGAALTVSITSPVTGTTVQSGVPITLTGSASVGDAPAIKNTDLVFVLDTSGSTQDLAIDCAGDADVDSILDCEREAVRSIVAQAQAPRSPIANIGIATFPAGPSLALTSPSDTVGVDYFLSGLSPGGGTDFSVGVAAALQVLSTSTAAQQLIVLLTDGDGTADGEPDFIQAVVLAFTFAGAGCSDEDLQRIIAVGDLGSSCADVTDLGSLAGVIQETVGSTLETVQVTVDGGAPLPVVEAVPSPRALPLAGPTVFPFTASLPALTAGTHQVCATATGSDAGGPGTISSCIDITALPPGGAIVDCGAVAGTCTATATDTGKSTLAFSAPAAFDEQVTISPNAGGPTECGGAPCRTGYDVTFPTTSANGPIATITVVTATPVPARERKQAAVFIDGVKITAKCDNRSHKGQPRPRGYHDDRDRDDRDDRDDRRHHDGYGRDRHGRVESIPCAIITVLRDGRIEYFVKFAADPAFRLR